MREYLTPADAAPILGVTAASVRLMESRGELLAAAKTAGGIRLFNRDDVEALAARRRGERRRSRRAMRRPVR
jgi:DNA-binding transcriptional MerR regulator